MGRAAIAEGVACGLGHDAAGRLRTEVVGAGILAERDRFDFAAVAHAVEEIAKIAYSLNESIENIGARRLQTVMEKLMEDLLFETVGVEHQAHTIDAPYVREKLKGVAEDLDLSRYIL